MRPITFWGIESFRRALLVCEPDVSSARRKVSCLFGLFLAAAGILGGIREGVSTSSRFHHAVRLARFASRAASLPPVCASLFAKTVSALRTTHLAALRPGTCIYIIRLNRIRYTDCTVLFSSHPLRQIPAHRIARQLEQSGATVFSPRTSPARPTVIPPARRRRDRSGPISSFTR